MRYKRLMNRSAQVLIRDLRALSVEDREALADELAEASDDQAEIDSAWRDELDRRRSAALANDFADTLSVEELFQQLEQRRKGS